MFDFFTHPSMARHRLVAVLITILGIVLIAAILFVPAAADESGDRISTLTGEHQNQQFLAGERVEVTRATVTDDIFAAGRKLEFDKVSAENIIAAGETLTFNGVEADDLILAGRHLELSGQIADDILAAGESVHLSGTMDVGGDARLAGRTVTVDGLITGDLYAVAKRFRLSGDVAGDVWIKAERIVLVPGVRIGGDLKYSGEQKPDIPAGVTISGQVRQVDFDMPFTDDAPGSLIWFGVLIWLGFLLALMVLGTALQFAVPGLLSGAASVAVHHPWASLGRGLALFILVPLAVALLIATLVGMPVGLVTIAAFVVLLALAHASMAYCIGLFIRSHFAHREDEPSTSARIGWTLAGIVLLAVVGLIPFIGWAISLLALVTGLGAVIVQLVPRLRRPDGQPVAA